METSLIQGMPDLHAEPIVLLMTGDRSDRSASSVGRRAAPRRPAVDSELVCAAMTDVLERLEMGVLLVDRYSQVIHHNAAAEELLRRPGSALRIEAGNTIAAERENAAGLSRAVQTATELPGEQIAVRLEREDASLDIIVVAAETMRRLPVPERFAAVFVAEGRRSPGSAAVLGRMYGLRNREIEVVEELLRGTPTVQIARNLHISPHTVRSHLKSIFAKTRTRRQTEVAALFGGSLSTLRMPRRGREKA